MMMIATSEDDNDDDGDGATGNEVNDDGAGATGDGATGYDNKVVTKYLYGTMVFLHKAKSTYLREPWLTSSIKTNGTIRVQCGNNQK